MAISGKEANQWIKPLAIGLGLYAGWRYVVSPLLEAVNLKDSKEDINVQQQDVKAATGNPWDPNYKELTPKAAAGGTRQMIKPSMIDKMATDVWDAQPLYWPLIRPKRYEMAAGVIRGIKYKTQISHLAAYFKSKYKQDLYSFLKNEFSTNEVATLNQLVNNKPTGFFTKNGTPVK